MVKKLVAVGCSYTENNYSFPVWPELLSKEYNYKCINLGHCGSGNEYIFSNALDASIKEKDIGLMVMMWSEFQRMDWQQTNKSWSSIHYNVNCVVRNKEQWKEDIVGLLDKNGYNSKEHQINRTLRYMYSIQQICTLNDIPILQLFGPDPCPQNEKYKAGKTILNSPLFHSIECMGWPIIDNMGGWTIDTRLNRGEDRISSRDTHPSEIGHRKITSIIRECADKITHKNS